MKRTITIALTFAFVALLACATLNVEAQNPKAVVPADPSVKFPDKENQVLKDLQSQVDKLAKDYNISAAEKELKDAKELYDKAAQQVLSKYNAKEYSEKVKPIQEQMNTVIQFAAIDTKLTPEQRASLQAVPDSKGDWSFVAKPADAKAAPPKQ